MAVESAFAQAFLSIQARIKDQVPEIAWIDQDLAQLEHYDVRPAVQFPCCLIDFINFTFKEMGDLDQWGEGTIQLRLGFAPFSSANSAAPLVSQEEALQYYELENKVFKALHGWIPEYGGVPITEPLIRTTAVSELRDDTFRVRVNHYTTAYEDGGAMPVRTTVKAALNITPA